MRRAVEVAEPAIADVLAELGYPAGAGFLDMLRHMADGDPARLAVEHGDRQITYGELLSMVAGAATDLESRGVEPGEHVAYMVTAHPNALATYLAVIMIGAVLVPIYSEIDGEVLRATLDRLDVNVLVLDENLRERVEPFADALPKLRDVIDVTGSDYAAAIDAGGDIAAFLQRTTPTAADRAMILSTSGTTGTPKGVTQFGSFCVASYVAYKKWGRSGPIKAYICTSWGHGTIQFMSTLAFWTGGSVVLAERFSASRYFHEVHRYGCTYIHLIGTMQRMLFNQPRGEHDEDHGVLLCLSAGMPPDVWERFEDRFHVEVVEIYSSTDAGGSWVTNPARYPVGSVGRPWAETEARVVDDDGVEVPDGTIGELQLRPRSNRPVIHYYNDSSASLDKIRDGWVWMGDYFKRDPEGNLWFVDRKRDLIRRRGINLAPASIEDAIRAHEGVFDVCAIAVPSELGEDDIKVVVVPTESTLSPRALGEFAEGVLPKHMRPRYIEMAEQLPMTSGTQRVVRYQLRETWRNPRTWDVDAGAFVVAEE